MMDASLHVAAWFHTAAKDTKALCAVCGDAAPYVLRTTSDRMAIREDTYTKNEWNKHGEDWIANHDHREYRCAAHAPRVKKKPDADKG